MAKSKTTKVVPELSAEQQTEQKLLKRIRERYKIMTEADRENREGALADLKFLHIPGMQWDSRIRAQRGTRPCYEINKTRIKAKRIINEMRSNRPQGKVRAVEDGDTATADIMEGLCRNIDNVSDMDTVADYAGEFQVGGGMGAWQVTTDYLDEDSFVQDIRTVPIKNPFCLYSDPASQDPLKHDARDWIKTEKLSKEAYEAKYGAKAKGELGFGDVEFDNDDDWEDEETIRVCEYWYKEPYDKEIWQVEVESSDGDTEIKTIAATDPAASTVKPEQIKNKRMSKCDRIMMCIASGRKILEGPTRQAGKNHRFVVVYGEWVVIDGKTYWFGLTRTMKDAQRAYNVSRTSISESIATAPNSHIWVTDKQALGHTDAWQKAIGENLPFLSFTPDPQKPGAPERMGGPDVPAASMAELQISDQDLKDCSGVYDASIGDKSNETSGVAIARRSEQTQIVNFNFPDNMAKARKRTWEIYLDLIPEIYDTERYVRVLGRDMAERYLTVNEAQNDPATGLPVVLNDLSQGKYDVAVTVGPSFATQRQQASEAYISMAQSDPALMPTAGDLVYKSLDLPYADEIAERRQAMLPPQIQQLINKDKKVPPEVQQAMAQIDQMTQEVQQRGQMVQAAAAEAGKLSSDAKSALADLKVKQAQFDADVARETADIVLKEANLALAEAKAQAKGVDSSNTEARAALAQEVKNAVVGLQQMGAHLMQTAAQTMADIQSKQQPQVVVANPPKRKIVHVKRVNGELHGEITDIPDVATTLQ
jgi:hypothetical protein